MNDTGPYPVCPSLHQPDHDKLWAGKQGHFSAIRAPASRVGNLRVRYGQG
jgi:hypothetical protein